MDGPIKKNTKSSQTSYPEAPNWKTNNIFCSQSPLAIVSLDLIKAATWSFWRLFSTQTVDDSEFFLIGNLGGKGLSM